MPIEWDPRFYDQKQRKYQLDYDRAIKKIRMEKNCSFKIAQRILRKRKLLEKLKEIEREEQEETIV